MASLNDEKKYLLHSVKFRDFLAAPNDGSAKVNSSEI